MKPADRICLNLGMGLMIALAAALGVWDAAVGGAGALLVLNILWWREKKETESDEEV